MIRMLMNQDPLFDYESYSKAVDWWSLGIVIYVHLPIACPYGLYGL